MSNVAADSALERHLIREGIIQEDDLPRLRAEAGKTGQHLVDVAEPLGIATAEAMYRGLATFCELDYAEPSKVDVPKDVVSKAPARFVTHYNFVPVGERNGTLKVAVSEPLNAQLLDDIRMVVKQRVEPVVATPAEIGRSIKKFYGLGADTVERILGETEGGAHVVRLDDMSVKTNLGDESIDPSIIKFVNEMLLEAVQAGATDIHIEPFEDELRVRFRIDGVLHGVPIPPTIRGFQAAITSRVKIMANLNIAEKRLPQDGKIVASLGDEQYDLRVSILPTPYGESINVRILNRASMFMTLEMLGFQEQDLKLINSFLERPHGIILVTGPTGSGKTTTLYASLAKLNSMERKTITIEDPIEYQLKGITQMQVLPQIGFDFATGLRSMLRHDPDIMMVGEIRDYEAAEMAVRSSLTGHLVFSTLHTNDAAGAVTRLIDMGVEPFLIASTMIASIAQRLVRRVCERCAEPHQPDEILMRELGVAPELLEGGNLLKGRGCDACRHTGYKGRIAIYELLPFSNAIKELTVDRSPSTVIHDTACRNGMQTLRESGWARVRAGVTTVEEVLRVTADAEIASR